MGEPGAGLEGQAVRTCPGEAATQPSQEALCAEDLSAQVSCKASGCPPFQASCTCVETRPVAGGREKWGGGEAEVPSSVCQGGEGRGRERCRAWAGGGGEAGGPLAHPLGDGGGKRELRQTSLLAHACKSAEPRSDCRPEVFTGWKNPHSQHISQDREI